MKKLVLATAILALVLAGCGKKSDTTATGGEADTTLAKQNASTPAGGTADTAKAPVAQAERGGTALPAGTPENSPSAREHERKSTRRPDHHRQDGGNGGNGGGQEEHASRQAPPQVRYVTVPAGKTGQVALSGALSSETNKVGDTFTATLGEAWVVDGETVLPAGTKVMGHVNTVESAARGKAKARLGVSFDQVELPDGKTLDIDATPQYFQAGGTTGRDVAVTGAGAVIGGLIGHAAGDTKKGAIVGGVVGGAAALGARGKAMELADGQKLQLVLHGDARVPVVRGN